MKRPAIFLDRDGVIIQEVDNLYSAKQLKLLPGVGEAIRTFNRMGFWVVVITNQPVIARGWVSEEKVEAFHKIIERRLLKRRAKIDAFYYCPHHPKASIKKYRTKCNCRKPGIALIKKAEREMNIYLKKSFFIGDSTGDIQAGKNAKTKTILVGTGYAGKDGKYDVEADFKVKNLPAAVKVVKRYV